ncbi:MAG: alpha/beta hydrolase [Rikenellaceae bacterium]|nr:alpha/beta hydrolase [Rikenellaceae bacterium]
MPDLFSIKCDSEYIHGIIDIPDATATGHTGKAFIFLHGAGGHRTGPHDMLSMFSARLACAGYYCIRFDHRGWGYSGEDNIYHDHRTIIEEVDLIREYIKSKYGVDYIALLGICSGAKIALFYAKTTVKPVRGLVMLSSSALRNDEKGTEVKIKELGMNSQTYIAKVFRRETWKKLFSGEINYRKIISTVLGPLKSRKRIKKTVYHNSKQHLSFENLKGPVLVIQAEKDPETLTALPQIEKLLSRHNVDHESHIIKGANHSFYSIKWKNEVYNLINDWIYTKMI